MTAPKLTFAMIKTIDFNSTDPHAVVKALNSVIEEKALSDDGKCPHRPASLLTRISGDFAEKANGSFCVYCSEEIEIDRILWRPRSRIPSAPSGA